MRNKIYLQTMHFTNPVTGDETIGFTLSDNFESLYCDTLDYDPSLPELLTEIYWGNYGQKLEGFLDDLVGNKQGIHLNGVWKNWKEIEHLFLDNDA